MGKEKIIPRLFIFLSLAVFLSAFSSCASIKRLTYSKQEKLMFDSFRTQVHETVSDPVRAEQLIEVGESVAMELHDYLKEMSKTIKKCIKANADYDTTPEQLSSCFQQLDEQRRAMREILFQAHTRTVMLTTESEWEELSSRKITLKDFMERHPELF